MIEAIANWGADILFFFLVIAVTLGITWWAARRTNTTESFYAADRSISGLQNGFAISGDFMSAATFLGIMGLFFAVGFDAVMYIIIPPAAFCILIFLIADRLRNLGRYTFTDVISSRLNETPARVFAAISTLVSAIMYLVAQVVGAGALIQVLFGIPYGIAVIIVGALMVLYVAFGGMLATTWVQITKAALLIIGVIFMAVATLALFDFNLEALYRAAMDAHRDGALLTKPGGLGLDGLAMASMTLGLLFGIVGSPHILMRFFTVPDAHQARFSAFAALAIISLVFTLLFFIIGFGATALVTGNSAFTDTSGAIIGGNNMVAIHLAKILGGDIFLGIISAVAFATILAVVAGLTLASASAVSHDIYARVIRKGSSDEKAEVRVSRAATVLIGVVTIILGIGFEGQNIAYLIALALTVAASANFPVLFLSMYWRGLTTRGAITGGYVGLVSSVSLVALGPAVWVGVLGNEAAIFPFAYPAIFSMSAAFLTIWLVSLLDKSARSQIDREAFEAQRVTALLGE